MRERTLRNSSKNEHMIWPGTGDPYKRKKTIKFLIITAIIGISAAAVSSTVQQ